MSERVTVSVSGHVADVRLNRPDKMNAMDRAMAEALAATGAALASDPTVRAIVLSGEGRGFCAGLDLANFGAMADRPASDPTGKLPGLTEVPEGSITHRAQQAAWVWQECPVPVIAAIHGVALGAGAQIALAADIRIAAPDARIGILEVKWGLIPDMTATATLVRLVGLDVAKELVWTSRMVRGVEAKELGLVTHLAEDPLGAAMELAAEIAGKSPDAIRAAKRLFNAAPLRTPAETFAAERVEIHSLMGSPNQLEAIRAGLADDTPRFSDPD